MIWILDYDAIVAGILASSGGTVVSVTVEIEQFAAQSLISMQTLTVNGIGGIDIGSFLFGDFTYRVTTTITSSDGALFIGSEIVVSNFAGVIDGAIAECNGALVDCLNLKLDTKQFNSRPPSSNEGYYDGLASTLITAGMHFDGECPSGVSVILNRGIRYQFNLDPAQYPDLPITVTPIVGWGMFGTSSENC